MKTANVDGFKYPWPFPKQPSTWYKIKSRMTMSFVYLCSKLMFTGVNKLKVHNRKTLTDLLQNKKRSLLTISNHRCNIDDPLVWASVPLSDFFTNIDRFRYTPTAHNICFTRAWHTRIFSLGRCVPIVRGSGVFQECMDFCIDKLNEKQWVHIFPEGKVTSKCLRFKWGIGRLLNETKEPPIILPIWVKDMNTVWPDKPPYYPLIGKTVEVFIGDPVDSKNILKSVKGITEIEKRKEITDYLQDVLFSLGGCKDLVKK